MVIIFTERISSGLLYAAEHIFGNVLGVPYSVCDQLPALTEDDIVISYGVKCDSPAFTLYRSDFIVNKYYPDSEVYREIISRKCPYFYDEKSDYTHSVDIFSLCLFSLSRYEEYVLKPNGKYGRFSATQSIFYRDGILQIPHLDRSIFEFAEKLKHSFPTFQYRIKKAKTILSIDVDHAWKYRNKGFVRIIAGSVRDLLKLNFSLLTERLSVLTGKSEDPYFSFEKIEKSLDKSRIIYFFLLGDYNKIDINVSHKNPAFRKLIGHLSGQYAYGIHPSSRTSGNPEQLTEEITRLATITGQKITKSRQHFLLIKMPETYQILTKAGITSDYSMGYADEIGFRAGTAYPFRWFDLERNETTPLTVYPFVAMDVAMRDYLKMKPADAFQKIDEMHSEVQKYGGQFILLWHNSSFIEMEGWSEWKSRLVDFLQKKPD